MHCCGRAVKNCQGQSVVSRLRARFLRSAARWPSGVGPQPYPKRSLQCRKCNVGPAAAAAAIYFMGEGGGSMKSVRARDEKKTACKNQRLRRTCI